MSDRDSTANDLARALAQRFGHDVAVPDCVGEEGLAALLRMARHASHRAWASEPVPSELIELLAACALCAPTKSYLQQCDIIQVRDGRRRARIAELMPSLPWLADAPALLIFCGNGRRLAHLFDRSNVPFPNDHLDAFFNPTVDASLVLMAFLQAAEAVGLAGCPISLVRNRPAEISDILELPDRVFPVAGLCVGYPAQAQAINPRLPLEATFRIDRVGPVTDDAAIADFDRRYAESRRAASQATSQAATMPPPWSDDKVVQYSVPQRTDWSRHVQSKGFKLS